MLADPIDFVPQQGILVVVILNLQIAFVLLHHLDDLLLILHAAPQLVYGG